MWLTLIVISFAPRGGKMDPRQGQNLTVLSYNSSKLSRKWMGKTDTFYSSRLWSWLGWVQTSKQFKDQEILKWKSHKTTLYALHTYLVTRKLYTYPRKTQKGLMESKGQEVLDKWVTYEHVSQPNCGSINKSGRLVRLRCSSTGSVQILD